MEKLPPERSETGEEKQKNIKPNEAFRNLAEKLLTVSPDEMREKEREWKHRQLD